MQGRQFTTGGCISLAAGPGGVWAAAFGEADAAQAVRVALERGANAAVDEVTVQRWCLVASVCVSTEIGLAPRAQGANHSDALWHREDLQRRARECQADRVQQDWCN